MKRSIGPAMLVIALAGFATLAGAQTASMSLPHYTVINLGTLGGSIGDGYGGVSDNGWVSGDSYLPGDHMEHAALWRLDAMGRPVVTDLGAVGGPNSSTGFPQNNNIGLIAGQTQGKEIDRLGEYWGVAYVCNNNTGAPCDGYQHLQFGFLWQNGVMTRLLPLGGYNSSAAGVNNLGQVAGWAETATEDPNCIPPQQLDFKAVIYGPKKGEIHELPTYGNDPIAAAFMINDNGEAVGTSGLCGVPANSSPNAAVLLHAVVWRNGSVSDLGSLGGVVNNAAFALNNSGQIVGISDPSGDVTTYGFLWQNGVMTPLYPLKGDASSMANDINAQGQVVGVSCDASFNCRAVLWDRGVVTDLNALVPTGSLQLTFGSGINDRGEIAGTAFDPTTGDSPAFLAIPSPTAQISGNSARQMILPANVRVSLQRRLRFRHFGDRATAQQ